MTDVNTLVENAVNHVVAQLTAARFFEVEDLITGKPVGINIHNISTVIEMEDDVVQVSFNCGFSIRVYREKFIAMLAYAGAAYHKLSAPEVEDEPEAVVETTEVTK